MKITAFIFVLAAFVALCYSFPGGKAARQLKLSRNQALIAALYAMAEDYKEASIEAGGFQIGEAIVGSGANSNSKCKHYVGKKATGRYDSCNHQGCTEAKNKANANLRLGVKSECQRFITSTTPCKKYHC